MRDVTKVSFGFLSFSNFYLLRKKNVPQGTIPVVPLYFHSCTHLSSCLFFYSIHLACSCSLIPLVHPQHFLSPSCLPALLPFTNHWSPFLLQRPSPTFSSTYFPSTALSSSYPSLLALPSSPGLSWGSCTQLPRLCMQSYQLSSRLQWH